MIDRILWRGGTAGAWIVALFSGAYAAMVGFACCALLLSGNLAAAGLVGGTVAVGLPSLLLPAVSLWVIFFVPALAFFLGIAALGRLRLRRSGVCPATAR